MILFYDDEPMIFRYFQSAALSISWMKFQSCSFVYLIRTTICELDLTELSTDQIEQQISKYFTMMSFGYHSNNTANHHTNSKQQTYNSYYFPT